MLTGKTVLLTGMVTTSTVGGSGDGDTTLFRPGTVRLCRQWSKPPYGLATPSWWKQAGGSWPPGTATDWSQTVGEHGPGVGRPPRGRPE